MTDRRIITDIFAKTGIAYLDGGAASSFEIAQGHDVHMFVKLAGRDVAIHVQGYPGMSSPDQMYISARKRNYIQMLLERVNGASLGNEHNSNIHTGTGLESGVYVDPDPIKLSAALKPLFNP